MSFIEDTEKEYYKEANESNMCFGNYIDSEGNVCDEGSSGLCNYCVECRRVCGYV